MDSSQLVMNILQKLKNGDKLVETKVLDIKGEWYANTEKDNWKDEFIKDICALANNTKGGGKLILGLFERKPFLKEITLNHDEAQIQELIKSNIEPIPKINVEKVKIDGANIFVLTVYSKVKELPYFAKKSDGNHFIHIRRGSSTDLCKKQDLNELLDAKREKEIDFNIEVQALKEIKEIEFKTRKFDRSDWNDLFYKLRMYATGYGIRITLEVLNVLIAISGYVGSGIKKDVTSDIINVAEETIGFALANIPYHNEISSDKIEILEKVLKIGDNLGYLGTRKIQDPKLVGAGTHLLWRVFRFSHLNEVKNLKTKAIEAFKGLEDWAVEEDFNDAVRWIRFQREDALALDDDSLPNLPCDIFDKFTHY